LPLSPGDILQGRYRIEKLLGKGGFGAIYQAWDANLNEFIALKESLLTTPEAQRQFQQEAKMLFKLRHPNLPVVHDFFTVPGQGQYLVMDFIAGEDLATLVKRNGPLQVDLALRWINQVGAALVYLHSQQPSVIHRDIKPANLILTPDGKVFLVDFGIAKVGGIQQMTMSGARGITPGYSSPEQYGMTGTDAQSDVYSLAATAYTLLTGKIPADAMAISLGEAQSPPPVYTLNPMIPRVISQAIEAGMHLSRNDRTQRVVSFLNSLNSGLTPAAIPPQRNLEFSKKDINHSNKPGTFEKNISPTLPSIKPVPNPVQRGNNHVWFMFFSFLLIVMISGSIWLGSKIGKSREENPELQRTQAVLVSSATLMNSLVDENSQSGATNTILPIFTPSLTSIDSPTVQPPEQIIIEEPSPSLIPLSPIPTFTETAVPPDSECVNGNCSMVPYDLDPQIIFPGINEIPSEIKPGKIQVAQPALEAIEIEEKWNRIVSYERFYSHPDGCDAPSGLRGLYIEIILFEQEYGATRFFDNAHQGFNVNFLDNIGERAYRYQRQAKEDCPVDYYSITLQRLNTIAKVRVRALRGEMSESQMDQIAQQLARYMDNQLTHAVR
jgi:serine/threonine protein kinase